MLGLADISSKPKNAETLLDIVLIEIQYCLTVLGIILVAWCTDASGESLKMRRLLRAKYPWIVTLDCKYKQINLVVGDYFKLKTRFINVVNNALEVVKWFNSHSRALGILKDKQRTKLPKVLALILPVLTRWTSHYLSVRRLLELEYFFRLLVLDQESRAVLILCAGAKAEQKRKAEEIMKIIEDSGFWSDLKIIRSHLEPLAIAANVTQSDFARLDVVLLTLANLFFTFSNPEIEATVRIGIHESLEKRWKKADQPVFLLAVVFNPYIRTRCFHPNSPFKLMRGLWPLVKKTFRRFFDQDPDSAFRQSFANYIAGVGSWSDEAMSLRELKELATAEKSHVNLVSLWREHDTGLDNGPNGIVKLAMRILSIVANSAGTERLFSKFGIVHTKHRNRMHHEQTRKIVLVKSDVEERHGRPAQTRNKRKFQDDESTSPHDDPDPFSSLTSNSVTTHSDSTTTGEPDQSTEEGIDEEPIPEFVDLIQGLVQEVDEVEAHGDDADEEPDPVPVDEPLTRAESLMLKHLFHYPTHSNQSPASLAFFREYWTHAETSLQVEVEFHDILHDNP